jgi:hypothetical protein
MKEIFTYNSDINKTAYINWRTSHHDHIYNMIVIADGFMDSALQLTKDVIDDNKGKRADIFIYPILFNANHAIELYLKAITWTLNIVLNKPSKIEGQHDIRQIFQTVRARVDEFETDKKQRINFRNLVKNLELYIEELFGKIQTSNNHKDNMDFSRYPFDQKYTPHFYINDFDNVVVDLENFYERFTEIGNSLKSISRYYLYDILDYINESSNQD